MRKLGIWLGGIAVVLLVGAGLSLIAVFDTDAGDVQAIESSLIPTRSLPSNDQPAREVSPVQAQPSEEPSALMQANQVSRLDQLADVPARAPVALEIDALGVNAPIEGYGIDQRTGLMDVPDNVREVGWYEYGPSPGESGSSVLAAHVDLKSQGPGVFFGLRTLDPGELITITYDDGSVEHFEVKARNTYLKDELPLDLIFSRGGAPVITLITCGGGFSASDESYDSNVVVYAVPVGLDIDNLPLS